MKSEDSKIRKGCKDNFHAFLVDEANFDGYYDIPFIEQKFDETIIKNLVAYDKTKKYEYMPGDVIHFYLDDQKFDGRNGIWNGLTTEKAFKKGFNFERIRKAFAIITPDFSLYLDMPRTMQIFNVYRSRAVGYYLAKLGYNVIINVRWTDKESFNFAFAGIKENQILSVGTLGCSKMKNDKKLLITGFYEMVIRLKPKLVLIYGPIINEIREIIDLYNVKVIQFESDIQKYFKNKKISIN